MTSPKPDPGAARKARDNSLGQYLRLLRVKSKLTMVQAAELSGVTQGYISQIENGLYQPSGKVLAKLARAYKVQEVQLLRRAGIVDQGILDRLGLGDPAETGGTEIELHSEDSPEHLGQLLRRNLALLELIAEQQRSRDRASGLPRSEVNEAPQDAGELSEYSLPLYDNEWRPVLNAAGEPAGLRIPASQCNYDPEAFILCVDDAAMEPQICRGDWVIISPATDPEPGQIAAVNDSNRIHLRHYMPVGESVALVPVNPLYASGSLLEGDGSDSVDVLGRVLRLVNRDL
ncbi:helix-turn-helix domain-containing protein [bacterium]|nr:helix-turn-helix domain-containing protein [bacterium]